MLDQQIIYETIWMFLLAAYAFSIIFLTKSFYKYMLKKRFDEKVVIYYNRKLIHIFAGGVIVLLVPFVFSNPFFPLLSSILMGIVAYYTHKVGKSFYWFQAKDNFNDVSFCFMWGIAIFILWTIFDSPWVAIIPPAFIAFGDGITGIIRNLAFKERRKHPIGNLYMAGVCIPVGYYFAAYSGISGLALWGVFAAVAASLFERYEIGIIDDNILVAGSSTIILFIGGKIGPII